MTRLEILLRTQFAAVEHVEDANRRFTVEVTKQDVAQSKRKEHQYCVMAEACKAQVPGLTGILISTWSAYLILGTLAVRFRVPPLTRAAIIEYDRTGWFLPGLYYLNPPPPADRLGAPKHSGPSGHSNPGALMKRYRKLEGVRTHVFQTSK